jgi:hypothetical protein
MKKSDSNLYVSQNFNIFVEKKKQNKNENKNKIKIKKIKKIYNLTIKLS